MSIVLSAPNYALDTTLASGQAFRWQEQNGAWEGVVASHWVRLRPAEGTILVETAEATTDWSWLRAYLQLEQDLDRILRTFPRDEPLRRAVKAWPGLRLLRQDPWECLASFILSSTKQIVQIQQVVGRICERYGADVPVPVGHAPVRSFPTAERLARRTEAELRTCQTGFRAPYLLTAARRIAQQELDLSRLTAMPLPEARAALMELPGVGRKIADCVLLFAGGFNEVFPLDVWTSRALRDWYFPNREVKPQELQEFASSHFGSYGGFAQQYLFHHVRTKAMRRPSPPSESDETAPAPAKPEP